MAQKTRKQLQDLFKQGAKPSGDDFSDFVESTFNIKDDGLEKPVGADAPLKIISYGAEENLLDFYTGNSHSWRLNQKPSAAETAGLNFENTEGSSKLFIASSSGNVGVGTTSPNEKLEVDGTVKATAFEGNGANLTDLDASQITSGTLDKDRIPNTLDSKTIKSSDPLVLNIESSSIGGTWLRLNNTKLDNTNLDGGHNWNIISTGTNNREGAGKLVFNDQIKGGGSRMIIDTDGKVGIGTTSPGEKLEVKGTVKATAFEGDGANLVRISAAKITSDKLSTDRIPNLSATKITTDQFSTYRIPDLSANKITSGKLKVSRLPNLFHIKAYENVNDRDTGYSTSDWQAAIIGFSSNHGDIDETGDQGAIMKMFMTANSSGRWHIIADFKSHFNDEDWTVIVLFIRKELVEDKGRGLK